MELVEKIYKYTENNKIMVDWNGIHNFYIGCNDGEHLFVADDNSRREGNTYENMVFKSELDVINVCNKFRSELLDYFNNKILKTRHLIEGYDESDVYLGTDEYNRLIFVGDEVYLPNGHTGIVYGVCRDGEIIIKRYGRNTLYKLRGEELSLL